MDINSEEYLNGQYKLREQLYKEHKLTSIFFEVTSRCNARCEHCGSSCGDFIPKDEVTKEEFCSVLDDIAAHYNPNEIMIMYTGGEPLVKKEIFDIMDYSNKLGFINGMTSNGILIDEKVVKKFEETNLQTISISLDGPKELHESFRKVPNSYEKIIKGLKLMKDCPTIKRLQVTTCVNKKNIDHLDEIYKIVKDIGIKDWRIIPVDPIGRANNNKDLLLDGKGLGYMFSYILRKRKEDPDMQFNYSCGHFLGNDLNIKLIGNCYYCFTGAQVASILSNGDIFGCTNIERRPELIQGNIRKDKFSDVWENRFKEFRTMDRTSNEKCKKCPDWRSCGGDAFHTWDFENNKPKFCVRELFKDHYEEKNGKKEE